MNHPTPDQWTSFVYGEEPAARQREMEAHARACPECAATLRSLRAGMDALDAWQLDRQRTVRGRPAWKWAAAAAVLFALGLGLGRFSGPNPRTLRASFQVELETRLAADRAETDRRLAELTRDYSQRLDADHSALLAAVRQLDSRRAAELARLRRDIDTVAVVADSRLSEAQEQLYQLANITQPIPDAFPDDR